MTRHVRPILLHFCHWECISRASHVAERTNGKITPDGILCFYAGMNFLEKADNRIVLHIRDSVIIKKREKILVRTVDSDDVVILMGSDGLFMQVLQYSKAIELSVDLGLSDSRRLINIIPLFHAFSGCDSTACFLKTVNVSLLKLDEAIELATYIRGHTDELACYL